MVGRTREIRLSRREKEGGESDRRTDSDRDSDSDSDSDSTSDDSSSDDNSSDSDSSSENDRGEVHAQRGRSKKSKGRKLKDDDGSANSLSSNVDGESSSDSEEEAEVDSGIFMKQEVDGGSGDRSSSDDSEGVDDDEDENDEKNELVPLSERMKVKEERGIPKYLNERRGRKFQAMKLAGERLEKFRKEKQKRRREALEIRKENDEGGVSPTTGSRMRKEKEEGTRQEKKKKSKHAPTEVSSKRSDFKRRKLELNQSGIGVEIGAGRFKPRDPRMDAATVSSTSMQQRHVDHQRYAFLQEIREKEIADLRDRVAARKATGKKGKRLRKKLGLTHDYSGSLEEDEEELKRLLREKASHERDEIDMAAKHAVKRKIQQGVAEGKHGVYYLKRKEKKRLQQEARYEEIKKRGGEKAVDKVLAKRRKKNKSRDAGLLTKMERRRGADST